MDIEKMYNDTKKRLNETSDLEENNYMKQLLRQDKLYYKQLDEVIETFPSSKISSTNTVYTTHLSALNGITKSIKNLDATLHDKVLQGNRKLEQSNKEIKNLKKMSINLDKNNGNIEDLDLTSKRLLNDYINIYDTNRLMIWIKGIIVFFLSYILFSDAMKHPELRIYIVLWGICIILLFVISYLRNQWATSTSLPKSATSQPESSSKTCGDTSMSCSTIQYGCCPDGVTVSDKNKLNCGCANSTYGCCPDGSNKNQDGTCTTLSDPVPCNQTQYGCCSDNTTISNSTGSNCRNKSSQPPLCSRTQYGCCPDGNTVSNADRSNCVGSCAFSEFGCCPNGVTISNKDRSNCNVPICTSSKYGCCPNGTTRNQVGSNC
jgi:hypothetical protein